MRKIGPTKEYKGKETRGIYQVNLFEEGSGRKETGYKTGFHMLHLSLYQKSFEKIQIESSKGGTKQ